MGLFDPKVWTMPTVLHACVYVSVCGCWWNRQLRQYFGEMRLFGLSWPNIHTSAINQVDNPYRHISTEVVGSAAHQQSSLDSAREGMILLKNDNNLLPLTPGKHVAVVGQSIDDFTYYTGEGDVTVC